MSYSFSAQGATKAEVKAKVVEQLAAVVIAQPSHAADQSQAAAAADAFIDILANDEAQDVSVSVNGSLWTTDAGVQQANISVTASLQKRT